MLEKCKKVFRSLLKLSQLIDWRCILLNSVVRKAMSVPSGKLRVDVPEHGPVNSPSHAKEDMDLAELGCTWCKE